MTCIVCDLPTGQYCEFCPGPARDPQRISEAVQRMLNNAVIPWPTITRSYKATYNVGDVFFVRTFIGPDSFLEAVKIAEGQREDGESLVNVTELT